MPVIQTSAAWLESPRTHAAALLLSLLAALSVAVFMVATLEYTSMRGRLLLSALLTGGYFLTTLAAAAMPKDGAMRWLCRAILAVATIALLLLLLGLWASPDSNGFWQSAAGLTLLAVGMSLTGLSLRLGAGVRRVRFIAWSPAVLAALLTALAVLGVALGIGDAPYWWAFALLVMGWLAVSVTLAVLRFWRKRIGDGQP